jgi:hypothetical protein
LFPDSIEIDDAVTPRDAESSMNPTFHRVKIDWSGQNQNPSDSIRAKCEFDSSVINKSERQFERHFDPRISTFLGIEIDWSDES